MFSSSFLKDLKVKALRKHAWFKLPLEERSIIDLTIKTVRIVKSRVLSSILIDIVLKILDLLENKFLEMIYKIGFNVARRYVSYALRWGNIKAIEWIEDDKYIFHLGLLWMNSYHQ
jgi:hypothetical protein